MNVERCIELHNEILRYGWVNSGHDLSQFETAAKPCMSFFGDDGLAILPDLAPELGQFLQQVRVLFNEPEVSRGYSFFFWVDNLAHPGDMFRYEEMWEMSLDFHYEGMPAKREYEVRRFILLYPLNQLVSHHVGLVFDQKSHLCILCPDLDDIDRILLKRTKWYPLDVVLDYWLSTIRRERIVAVPKNHPDGPFEDRLGIHPWRHRRFYDTMLDETLDAFNKLVEAIEARLPQGSSSLNDDSIEYGLVDADVLQIHEIAPGFAREFLACARTPRFKHIAAGLEVITTSTFSKQPFIPNPDEKANKHDVPAIFLFYSKLNYDNSPDRTEYGSGPFGYPCHQITTFPAGLYLDRTDWTMYDDACK